MVPDYGKYKTISLVISRGWDSGPAVGVFKPDDIILAEI